MHTASTQTIISHTPFSSSFFLTLTLSVLLPASSTLSPCHDSHSLCLLSLRPFKQRPIRWRLAHCVALSPKPPLTPNQQSEDEVGTWKVSGAVSHALHPEGQHFKRDDPRTPLQMKPNSHWRNCWGLREPLPLPKPCASGSPLTAVYPQLAWGELRLSKSCAMSQGCFFLAKLLQRDKSISNQK